MFEISIRRDIFGAAEFAPVAWGHDEVSNMEQKSVGAATAESTAAENTQATPDAPTATGDGTKRRPRAKPTKTKAFPSDRIKFNTQLELIRSYGVIGGTGKPVSVKEAAAIVQLSENTAALMNSFLLENGFLTKSEGGFAPSADVVSFAKAFQWAPDTASHKLRPIMERTWFADAIIPPLGMRPHDEKELIPKLADASQAGPEYKNHLRMLLDYLEAAGLTERDGSQFKLKTNGRPAPEEKPLTDTPVPPDEKADKGRAAAKPGTSNSPEGGVQFGVNVSIDMAELAGWSPDRIAALFTGIAQVLSAKAGVEK